MKIPYGIVFILSICLLAVGILGEQKGKSKRDKKASKYKIVNYVPIF